MMKVGMLFPGYGSQFVGMGKDLYDHSRTVQEYFEEASNCLGINFVKLCFASSDIELSKITHAYPSLFLTSVAVAAYIKEHGIAIDYVAGYGIGEYSALCAAGGLSFPDGLYLLHKLSSFYTKIREQLDVTSVVIEGLSTRKLKQICKEHSISTCCAQIAVYETKTEHIVTGHTEAVNAVVEHASDSGADTIKKVTQEEGFHTPLLNELAEHLTMYLTKVDFKDLSIPLITSVDAREVCRAKKAQDALIQQIIAPVYWHNVVKCFTEADILVIPAPAKSLIGEILAQYPQKKVIGIDSVNDLHKLQETIANL